MKAVEALAKNELNERLLLGQLNVFEKLGFVGVSCRPWLQAATASLLDSWQDRAATKLPEVKPIARSCRSPAP